MSTNVGDFGKVFTCAAVQVVLYSGHDAVSSSLSGEICKLLESIPFRGGANVSSFFSPMVSVSRSTHPPTPRVLFHSRYLHPARFLFFRVYLAVSQLWNLGLESSKF